MFRLPVSQCQRSMFGVVRYYVSLIIVGGQRYLGNAFGGDIVSPRS